MYNTVLLDQMLTHIYREFGEISHKDFKLNEAKFNKPCGGAEPFKN
jgi:hypothetical protein